MPWIRDDKSKKTPVEEIFGDGVTADSIRAQLKAGEEARDKLNSLETSFGAQFNEIKEALKNIQVTPASSSQSSSSSSNSSSNNGGTQEEEKAPDFFQNPEGAFNYHTNKVIAPLVNLTLQTRADQVFDKVKSSFSDFSLFEEEIRKEIETAPAQYKANEAYIKNAYHMVKGRHADEIASDRAKGSGKYFVESGTGNGVVSSPTVNKTQQVTLTQEEKDYAAKFGLTEQEYVESRKGLRYV